MCFKMRTLLKKKKKSRINFFLYYFRIIAKLKLMLKVNRDIFLHSRATKVVKTRPSKIMESKQPLVYISSSVKLTKMTRLVLILGVFIIKAALPLAAPWLSDVGPGVLELRSKLRHL